MTLDRHPSHAWRYSRFGLARVYAALGGAYTWSHATSGVPQGAAGSFGS